MSLNCDGEPKNSSEQYNGGGAHTPHDNSHPFSTTCYLPKQAMLPQPPEGLPIKKILMAVAGVLVVGGGGFGLYQAFSGGQTTGSSVTTDEVTSPTPTTTAVSPGELISSKAVSATLISQGEKILLIGGKADAEKQAGAAAFVGKNWDDAIAKYEAATKTDPNDPETKIYLNNATAKKTGNPLKIAVVVPFGASADAAKEVLRGAALYQDQFNKSPTVPGRLLEIVIVNNALAPTAEKVNKIAEQITVLIEGPSQGSGSIIAREGSTYYVLTCRHVIEPGGELKIVAPDRTSYRVDNSNIIQLPGVDLAIVPFVSSSNYEIAQLGDSKTATVGEQIYVSGWSKPGETITRQIRQMTAGQISARERVSDGYELIYTNPTRQGMSGGPILDSRGRVIGIHGRTEGSTEDTVTKAWVNSGIPINTFVELPPKAYAEQGKEKLKRQNYQGAIADFSQGLRFNQNSADVFNGLAYANFGQKNYRAALENAIKAIQYNPQLADAYRVRGASNAQLGNHKEAIPDFDRAIQINSTFADAYGLRGVSRAQIKDYIGLAE